jgi:transcriptional/translational regulatory protein YebC/TACO1
VRHAFTKAGGNLGTDGSVAYMFTRTGVLMYPPDSDEDAIMEAALEAGAEDVANSDDGGIEVTTTFEDFISVKDAMTAAGFKPESAEVIEKAANLIDVTLDDAEKIMRLIDALEDLDDVQDVHTNADFSDEVMAQLSS